MYRVSPCLAGGGGHGLPARRFEELSSRDENSARRRAGADFGSEVIHPCMRSVGGGALHGLTPRHLSQKKEAHAAGLAAIFFCRLALTSKRYQDKPLSSVTRFATTRGTTHAPTSTQSSEASDTRSTLSARFRLLSHLLPREHLERAAERTSGQSAPDVHLLKPPPATCPALSLLTHHAGPLRSLTSDPLAGRR